MFKPGDFVFLETSDSVHLVQILEASGDYLIKDFWECTSLLDEFPEIRSWVKRVPNELINQYNFLKNENLTEKDVFEIQRFLEIEIGLNYRKNRTASMFSLVEEAMKHEDFNVALDLLTEWAMLDKYRAETYLLREQCLRKLGRDSEADYERHVYNTLTGK